MSEEESKIRKKRRERSSLTEPPKKKINLDWMIKNINSFCDTFDSRYLKNFSFDEYELVKSILDEIESDFTGIFRKLFHNVFFNKSLLENDRNNDNVCGFGNFSALKYSALKKEIYIFESSPVIKKCSLDVMNPTTLFLEIFDKTPKIIDFYYWLTIEDLVSPVIEKYKKKSWGDMSDSESVVIDLVFLNNERRLFLRSFYTWKSEFTRTNVFKILGNIYRETDWINLFLNIYKLDKIVSFVRESDNSVVKEKWRKILNDLFTKTIDIANDLVIVEEKEIVRNISKSYENVMKFNESVSPEILSTLVKYLMSLIEFDNISVIKKIPFILKEWKKLYPGIFNEFSIAIRDELPDYEKKQIKWEYESLKKNILLLHNIFQTYWIITDIFIKIYNRNIYIYTPAARDLENILVKYLEIEKYKQVVFSEEKTSFEQLAKLLLKL